LPKSVVSIVAENVRFRRRDTEDTSATATNQETSKQEDNIMKIFVASGSNTLGSVIDLLVNIIADGLVHIMAIISIYLIQQLVVDAADAITNAAPHLTYLQGAWVLLMGSLTEVFQMFWVNTDLGLRPYLPPGRPGSPAWLPTKEYYFETYDSLLTKFLDFYVTVGFGNETANIPPYHGYPDGARRAVEAMSCSESLIPPYSAFEATSCMTPDMLYSLAEMIMQVEVLPYIANATAASIQFSATVQDLWSRAIHPIYNLLVRPMSEAIDVMIANSISSLSASTVPTVATLIALAFVLQVISIAAMSQTANEMRRVLMFLLHCPVQAVLQTPRVMAILSGDFGLAGATKQGGPRCSSGRRRDCVSRDTAGCVDQ
jgi:hypothetical protein